MLLTYPGREHVRAARKLIRLSDDAGEPGADALRAFAEKIAGLGADELEELFVRTFDLNPVCCLEVGWQIYGDRYERGMFMAEMRQRLVRFNIPETGELPDHLSLVLQMLAAMDEQEACIFAGEYVAEAVVKMDASLSDGGENPYRNLIGAIKDIVCGLSPSPPEADRQKRCDDDGTVRIALDIKEVPHG